MTIDEFAETLRNPDLHLYEEGEYQSHRTGRTGYRATFQLGGKWFWYSVSDITRKLSPPEVAEAVTSPTRMVQREGPYGNSGFEATVKQNGHWYMLGMGDSLPE
jgi:hypothetical protein